MNSTEYEKYVRDHAVWFRGHNPEKLEAIFRAEQRLGITFPESLKWLLTQYGYWQATGVAGLPCIVGATLANRPKFPNNWLLLGQPDSRIGHKGTNERRPSNETVILVLSNQHRWDGKAVFHCDSRGEIIDRYSGFTEYTIAKQHYLEKHSAREHRSCLPSFHLSRGEPLVLEEKIFNEEEFQRRLLETVLHQEIHADVTEAVGNDSQPTDSVKANFAPLPGFATVPTTATELISAIIEDRRESLYQNQHLIPSGYQDSSSSPRQNLRVESSQIEGHLLIAEFGTELSCSTNIGAEKLRSLLLSELNHLGIAEGQVVSLIREATCSGERDWLVCWISDFQFAGMTIKLKSHPRKPHYRFVCASEAENIISQLPNPDKPEENKFQASRVSDDPGNFQVPIDCRSVTAESPGG